MANWSDENSNSSTQDDATSNYLAFNVVIDTVQKLVEHIPVNSSSDEESEVIEEDIIKNNSFINEKCVMVV